MATILQTMFSKSFHSMEISVFYLNFNEMCSLRSIQQQACIGSDNGLVLNRRQAIIWTNDDLVYRRIYA